MPFVLLKSDGETIQATSPSFFTGSTFTPFTSVLPGDALYDNGIEIVHAINPNSFYWFWDAVNDIFVLDQIIFTEYLIEDIKLWRDTEIESESEVTGVFETETLGLLANPRTLEAVGRKCTVTPLHDNVTFTVPFKFNSFTAINSADIGYRTVTTDFLAEMYLKLDLKNQKFFDAEMLVLANHMTTPYTSLEDARTDANNFIATP